VQELRAVHVCEGEAPQEEQELEHPSDGVFAGQLEGATRARLALTQKVQLNPVGFGCPLHNMGAVIGYFLLKAVRCSAVFLFPSFSFRSFLFLKPVLVITRSMVK